MNSPNYSTIIPQCDIYHNDIAILLSVNTKSLFSKTKSCNLAISRRSYSIFSEHPRYPIVDATKVTVNRLTATFAHPIALAKWCNMQPNKKRGSGHT